MKSKLSGVFAAVVMSLWFSGSAMAATWTGRISDSSCGASHDTMTEHGKKMTDKACTAGCVKQGATYVFVDGGKVFKIGNQSFKDLATFAGDTVTITGDLKGDTITVSKIAKSTATK